MLATRCAERGLLRGLKRWQSSVGGAAAVAERRSPLADLKSVFTEEFGKRSDSWSIYSRFRNEVERLKESSDNVTHAWGRSEMLTSELSRLLRQTECEFAGAVADVRSAPPSPYDVLATLIQYNLARSSHFEQVIKYYISREESKDALGVWVNYLEASGSRSLKQEERSSTRFLASYALISYLMVESNVNLAVIMQLMKLEAEQYDRLPLQLADRLLAQLQLPEDVEGRVQRGLDDVATQIIAEQRDTFLNTLLPKAPLDWATRMYEGYVRCGGSHSDIIAAFMVRFASLGKPLQSMKCYNEAVKQYADPLQIPLPLRNSLLVVVSLMAAIPPRRDVKLQRVEAVWNTYIRSTSAIDVTSYRALLQSLINIGSFERVLKVWKLDIPNEYKQDSVLSELHTLTLSKDWKIPVAEVEKRLPEKLTSLELANSFFLKMILQDEPSTKIEKFYEGTFLGKDSIKPDSTTLAVNMYANYKHATDLSKFDFYNSSKIPKKVQSDVMDQFLEICPDIAAIRALYAYHKVHNVNPRDFGKFIRTEFRKGDWQQAEVIFHDFLTTINKKTMVTSSLLEPLFEGFANLIIKQTDSSYLLKIKTYWLVAQNIHGDVPFNAMIHLLSALSTLANRNAKLRDSELTFVNDLVMPELLKMKIEKNFIVNQKLLQNVRKDPSILIPKELL